MSTTTTNLGLTKPDETEYADVDVLNDNADIIDQAVGELQDSVARTRGTATDANDCTELGVYDIRASCSNVPSGVTWTTLLVLQDGVNLRQAIFQPTALYWRVRGSGNAWSAWQKVSGTNV